MTAAKRARTRPVFAGTVAVISHLRRPRYAAGRRDCNRAGHAVKGELKRTVRRAASLRVITSWGGWIREDARVRAGVLVAARPPTDEMAIRVRALRDHLGVSQE